MRKKYNLEEEPKKRNITIGDLRFHNALIMARLFLEEWKNSN